MKGERLTREERLLAYLDGELDAEECREVERLLAADEESRRFVEEMRAVNRVLKGAYGREDARAQTGKPHSNCVIRGTGNGVGQKVATRMCSMMALLWGR